MSDAVHKINKIMNGDDNDDKGTDNGGAGAKEQHEDSEEEADSSLSEEEKKKQKAMKAERSLRYRVENEEPLPLIERNYVQQQQQQHKRKRKADDGEDGEEGEKEMQSAVADFVVNGRLAKELFVELMNMMLMKWDTNAYRGGCKR